MADIGETRGGDKPDIARAKDRQFHESIPLGSETAARRALGNH
jgi:hypothetical protein